VRPGRVGSTRVTRASVGLRSERGPTLAAVMITIGLIALESTVLATAVPTIVSDLGGYTQFPWLFSAYLLTQAATVPIYGRLSDMFGRRPILLVGIGLFLVGSVLCGLAWSMPALIVARAVQGLGAGAIQPAAMTIVGDIYTVAERAKVQGYIASVWGMSSVVGPLIGGLFTEYVSWRWIFFVNLPIGALAVWMLRRHFHEDLTPQRHRVDYLGSTLLSVGSAVIVLGLLEGGVSWEWTSVLGIGVPAVGLLVLGVFVLAERRAPEPVLPLWVLRRRLLAWGDLVQLGVGALLIGLSSYVPAYVQGVLGHGPLIAGLALGAMSVGWPLAAASSGRMYLRIGFRNTSLIGLAALVPGTLPLTLLDSGSHVWQVALWCFLIGIGLGLVSSPTLVAMQSSVGWADRGVVTGASMFSRTIGSAIGVAVCGALANASLAAGASSATIARATHDVFVALAVIAMLMIGAVAAMPAAVRQPADEPVDEKPAERGAEP
jgi:EmrB/QacA subfamily drug resistance transporter